MSVPKMAHNVWWLGEVPHSRNFRFEQELSCGILANHCYKPFFSWFGITI